MPSATSVGMIGKRFLIEVADKGPRLLGPFADTHMQKEMARDGAAGGRSIFYLDAYLAPDQNPLDAISVGVVLTTDDGMGVSTWRGHQPRQTLREAASEAVMALVAAGDGNLAVRVAQAHAEVDEAKRCSKLEQIAYEELGGRLTSRAVLWALGQAAARCAMEKKS